MIVRNDQFDASQTATDEAVEECAPVDLRFGQGHRHPEHPPFAVGGDTDGHQDGAIDQAAGLAHTFVAGVEENIGGSPSGLSRQAARPASSCSAARLTWVDEIATSGPSSACSTVITLRVETPCTYISARGRLSARSVRVPFSRALG